MHNTIIAQDMIKRFIQFAVVSSIVGLSSAEESSSKVFLGEPYLKIQTLFKKDRFPNIVVTPKGTMLATIGRSKVSGMRSVDGGETWGESFVIAPKGIHGGGTTVNDANGHIFVFAEEKHPPAPLFTYLSKDDGITWNQIEIKIRPDSKGKMPAMHMNERGIMLKHGKYKGRIIRPSRNYGKANRPASLFPTHYTNAMYSDDGGKTWQTSDPFSEFGTGEAALAELSDGTLYYNSRRHWAPEGKSAFRRWGAWSSDGGHTWKGTVMHKTLPDGPQSSKYGCMGGLVRLPIQGEDIILYSNCDSPLKVEDKVVGTSGKGRHSGTIWASFDGGKTWPLKRTINKEKFAYSSMDVGRPRTKTEGQIYLHYESGGGSKIARFNLAWVLEGELTKDGEVPRKYR